MLLLSKLKAECIPLKREISQRAPAWFLTTPGENRRPEKGWPSFKYVLTEHKTRVHSLCIQVIPISTTAHSRQVTILLVSPQRDRQGLRFAEDLVSISQLEEATTINSVN